MVVRLLASTLSCKESLDHAIAEYYEDFFGARKTASESSLVAKAVTKAERNEMESTYSETTCLR